MLYARTGYPEEDELVLCTITNVQYNSVFCSLDEFPGKGGMIHISEVTAGRIRNIREYVMEGKKVVCKVLRIDKERGHIDLSLRRVNDRQRREKLDLIKQEMKAENILTHVAKEEGKKPEAFYQEVAAALMEHYPFIHQAFQAVVDEEFSFSKTKLDKKLAEKLEALVKERIKPKQVSIEGTITITTYAEDGAQRVSDALVKGREAAGDIDIRYLGAGHYKITVVAEEYKDAEKKLKTAIDTILDAFKKVPATTCEFHRVET